MYTLPTILSEMSIKHPETTYASHLIGIALAALAEIPSNLLAGYLVERPQFGR